LEFSPDKRRRLTSFGLLPPPLIPPDMSLPMFLFVKYSEQRDNGYFRLGRGNATEAKHHFVIKFSSRFT
jgi:hypothetical protein